jgi:hypothetical protein
MPLTRGEAVGYDADLMAFKFTMRKMRPIPCHQGLAHFLFDTPKTTRTNFRRRPRRAAG